MSLTKLSGDDMVAYNFIAQFADDIESGKKRQTIRKKGKRNPPKIGDDLQLYTGMRTKYCRLLKRGICIAVKEVRIGPMFHEVSIKVPKSDFIEGESGHYWLLFDSDEALERIARNDGFSSVDDFFDYFAMQSDNGVFEGYIIEWEPI